MLVTINVRVFVRRLTDDESTTDSTFCLCFLAGLPGRRYCLSGGPWNAKMWLSEKGYYFTVLMFGLFGAVSVQKSVRDRMEDIPLIGIYYGLSWFSTILSLILLVTGLWNADLLLSEKGFYGVAFTLSLFATICGSFLNSRICQIGCVR